MSDRGFSDPTYVIRYRSKYTGRMESHEYNGSRGGAEDWLDSLAKDHQTAATLVDGRTGRRLATTDRS